VLVGAAVIFVSGYAALRRTPGASAPDPVRFEGNAGVHAPAGSRVTVEVFNATKHRGLGRHAMFYLRDHGFDVVTLGTSAAKGDETVVVSRRAHPEWARLVAQALGSSRVQVEPDSSRDVDVSVYVGSAWRPPSQPFYP
jgi:hypothetical protein